MPAPIVAFDTETELIEPGILAPRIVCLQTYTTAEGAQLHAHRDAVTVFLSYVKQGYTFVGHNVAFDLGVLCAAGLSVAEVFRLFDSGRIRCTQIRETLDAIAEGDLNERKLSLDAIAQARLGCPPLDKGEDGWRTRYGLLRDTPIEEWPERARAYALADPEVTYRVFMAQADGAALPDEQPQTRAAFVLHLMGIWGIRTDRRELDRVEEALKVRLSVAEETARAAGFIRPNGTKDTKAIKAAVEAAYARLDLEVPRTEKGAVSTDHETLARTDDPALIAIGELTHVQKMLNTYVEAYRAGQDHAMNATWVPLVASGRTASRAPNLQNPPRNGGLRECLVPRKGWAFISVDYDFLELRTLAQSCLDLLGHSALADAIRAGEDPHLSMAAEILGITYEEALARKKEPQVKDARQLAKAANFGLPGGLGADNFREYAWATYRVKLSPSEATQLIDTYHRRWPEIRRFFAHVKRLAGAGGATLTLPRIGRVRGDCGFCDGCNYFFQGPAASGAKESLYRVSRACYAEPESPLYGCRPVLFVHDEIIIEAPLDRVDAAGRELARIMRDTMVEVATPDVPSGASPAAMLCWTKAAEAVFDADGKLIPWQPKEA